LTGRLTQEPVAVYAGAGKSGIYINGEWKSVEREQIEKAVKERTIRLVVATDAACEGLNLQTLGTLINVDLPWNPSRIEQRIGRIKRFGQRRDRVAPSATQRRRRSLFQGNGLRLRMCAIPKILESLVYMWH
jgi:superfamily II DNA/RNA helicase